jgi:Nif-specific regulatory protein
METAIRPAVTPPVSIDSPTLAAVLAEVAGIAAETLELQQVFERVANSIRRVIPLDNMGVVRIVDNTWAVVHAMTVPCARDVDADCFAPEPLTSWSPRLRPRPGPIPRVNDTTLELNPEFPLDAMLIEKGVRSSMWEPFRMGERFAGGVWAGSYQAQAFSDQHQEMLKPIAALMGSAVEHWRIWDAERRRRERLDQLEEKLASFAESLDVRDIFARVSENVREILPHDLLVLTELDVRRRQLRFSAKAGTADIEVPDEPMRLTEEELVERGRDTVILRDIPAEVAGRSDRERLMLASGMRSWMRVPVWTGDEVRGGLGFFSREPSLYHDEDLEVAVRLADRVGLMLSHQRLAEEARIAIEARERAERLEATVETLTRELEARSDRRVVGVSTSWKEVLAQVGRVASSETTVLVTGESGTGKEIVARLVRQGSPRAARPFVAVNCAALPEQLLESELFGHEKGAFTGAVAQKVGRIEQAAGGTLFLDEVGEMSPLVQAKLLRVLEEREFHRVGGTRPVKADVRVVTATNRDLPAAIARGQFREDLYYRLNVFEIRIPPLRERGADILPLAESFLEELGRSMGRPAAGISRDARDWLLGYSWPGNVRELRNAIERAILLCDGGLITSDHLPVTLGRGDSASRTSPDAALPSAGVDLDEMERGYVERALREARGNKSKAARLLGISRAQLYTRLEKHGLTS